MLSVSVVVPAYNEEALLSDTLDALLAQDYQGPLQIIVVDNASTDGTGRIARERSVTVVTEPDRGYCNALVAGFAAATGDIVACTDADTIVPPDWISRFVAEYERHPGIVSIGGGIEFVDQNWKSWFLTALILPLVNGVDRRNPQGPHLWGANLSVRRTAFEAVGGWNRAFSLQADSELSERMRRVGRVILIPSLSVRTSSRRWNQALMRNMYLYASNFVWFQLFHKPLYREFPAVRSVVRSATREAAAQVRRPAFAVSLVLVGVFAGVVYSALAPRSNAFGRTYWSGATTDKVVALTFDDGPNEPYTSQVLAILKREHVRATFFLIGSNIRRDPAAAARIARDGHVIGNHSDTHPARFALKPVPELRHELDSAENSIHEATALYPRFFRPPQGLRSPWLMGVLSEDSLVAVTWDDTPQDWDPLPPDELVKRALTQAHPGAIILLHDGMNLTPDADQSRTVTALPRIIDGLRAQGYRFVTIPELLGGRAYLSQWPAGPSRAVAVNPRRDQP